MRLLAIVPPQKTDSGTVAVAAAMLAQTGSTVSVPAITLGQPFSAGSGNARLLPIAIPLVSDNQVIGAFAATIDLDTFLAPYRELSVLTSTRIDILDARAQQLAELADTRSVAGKNYAGSAYAAALLAGPAQGEIHAIRPGETDASVGTFRRLDAFSVIVTVISDDKHLIARFGNVQRTYFLRSAGLSFFLVVLSAGLILLAVRQRRIYDKLEQADLLRHTLIDQLEAEKKHAFELASLDFLTGIPNRMMFYELANSAMARSRRSSRLSALLFLDLDKFKAVNDTLGHAVGDLLLKAVAERLRHLFRSSDIIARLGGDEFVVFVTELASEDKIAHFASQLLKAISKPYLNLGGHDIHLSTSVGIALYPGNGHDIDTLLSHADTAMYAAKMAGRDRYSFYDADLNTSSVRSAELLSQFHRALREDEFCLHYQMRFAARDFAPVGLEALVRWQHPVHGLIYPAEFIALAEDNNLIVALGNWVINNACAQIAGWQKAGERLVPVAINISAKQLTDHRLMDFIQERVAFHQISAGLIEIEVTESCFLEPPQIAEAVLRQIGELGIKIALDDYGTGFSGLSHLKRLPISVVKIDRSFIRDIRNDSSDAMIVASTISLCHNLGLTVVAEGVETKDQVVHLKTAGCDELQGFYFHRPAPARDIVLAFDRVAFV